MFTDLFPYLLIVALLPFAMIGLFSVLLWTFRRRYEFYEIQQHCAKAGRAQVDDTARVLRVLQHEPVMRWSLGLRKNRKKV